MIESLVVTLGLDKNSLSVLHPWKLSSESLWLQVKGIYRLESNEIFAP